jgi:hypothetical protein
LRILGRREELDALGQGDKEDRTGARASGSEEWAKGLVVVVRLKVPMVVAKIHDACCACV